MGSFKSNRNAQKKEVGQIRSVSNNQLPSVTPSELAMKASKHAVISSFSKTVKPMTDMNTYNIRGFRAQNATRKVTQITL